MPIKGLTDQQQFGSGWPRIAMLYKGGEKREREKNGRKYEIMGVDLDHFRIEFEPEFEHLRELWVEMYGEKPDSFNRVFLAGSTVEDTFPCWNEEWDSKGTLIHRCDGENQAVWLDKTTGYHCTFKQLCVAKATPPCECKETGRLNLILLDFIEASGVLGVVTVTTHSLNDIMTVNRYLTAIYGAYKTLAGVPFVFGRAAREMSTPKTDASGNRTGERVKVSKSLLFLYVEQDFARSELLPALTGALHNTAAPAPQLETGEYAVGDNIVTLPLEETRSMLGAGRNHGPIGRSEPATKQWTKGEVELWLGKHGANGHSEAFLRAALGIAPDDKWSAFKGDTTAADALVSLAIERAIASGE